MNEILLRDIWKLLPDSTDIQICQLPEKTTLYRGRKSLIPLEYFSREVSKLMDCVGILTIYLF